ncbi:MULTISPECIES: RNA polymerase factor sigma-54 [Caproicibacterium]|uniref:RNA polymerase factor sigma-54 n=1 Tax=Caproicibacterium argilliputei TaxID=3030016 RepID=A0AA97H1I0_9FIRM|nr:RNA polymerase factor sigma-54 [Caproicibacterium argilliputei]WOC32458.1 RNA polymerase factor sigma-54 [Caproicibacterium argilliputei]
MELSLKAGQTLKQGQQLLLSAQQRESLKVLQMPLPDLRAHLAAALCDNPVLEEGEPDAAPTDGVPDFLQQAFQPDCRRGLPKGEEERDPFYAAAAQPDFHDFLEQQLLEIQAAPTLLKICRYILGNLDDRGYLCCSPEQIAADLRVSAAQTQKALALIRQFEPAGVGAYDLRDCLLLQLQRLPACEPYVLQIADSCLDLLAQNQIRAIASRLKISVQQAQAGCRTIRSLNPIPSSGCRGSAAETVYVIPEAQIFKKPDGSWAVQSNRTYLPKIYINPFYLRLYEHPDTPETKAYLKEKIQAASRLLTELSERESTISAVLQVIVKLQELYFSQTADALRPMTMQEIAEQLRLNESTVSRAVQGKYILCRHGVVSIRSLFTNGLGHTNVSVAQVKNRLQDIFHREDPFHPLSDQTAAALLNRECGLEISRRAVAKYRQSLGIPASSKRKCFVQA